MRALILAAGLGTRFRPATYDLPKPLIPLCNEPLIGYAIRNVLEHGVREIAINLHHLPDELRQGVIERYGREADFEFSFEPEILGTGGGVRKLRSYLEGDEEFILLNGDTVQRAPLDRLIDVRRRSKSIAALSLRHPPLNDRFTRVWFDDPYITGFGEGHGQPLMFAGAHVIARAIFDQLPERDFSGITEDVYMPMLRAKGETSSLSGAIYDGFWFDIGTPLRYRSASDAMLALIAAGIEKPTRDSMFDGSNVVDHSAEVHGPSTRSSIGPRAVVEADASLEGSVVWTDTIIKARSTVTGSILGRGVVIPSGSRVSNALVCRALEIDYPAETKLRGDLAAVAIDPDVPLLFEID